MDTLLSDEDLAREMEPGLQAKLDRLTRIGDEILELEQRQARVVLQLEELLREFAHYFGANDETDTSDR